jgi:hypothetical protein
MVSCLQYERKWKKGMKNSKNAGESVCTPNWVILSDFVFRFFAVYVQHKLIFSRCFLFIITTFANTCIAIVQGHPNKTAG